MVVIEMENGKKIKIELYPDKAPITVAIIIITTATTTIAIIPPIGIFSPLFYITIIAYNFLTKIYANRKIYDHAV